jgi:hypothetical protein
MNLKELTISFSVAVALRLLAVLIQHLLSKVGIEFDVPHLMACWAFTAVAMLWAKFRLFLDCLPSELHQQIVKAMET